jgi:23S rRNA (uracil1939-C5)-methyltransferase
LRRVGKIEFDGEIGILSGPEWQYRNRVQLHIHNGKIGYFQAGSHELTAIDHCPISSPRLNEAIGKLARELPGYRGFSATVELFTNEAEMQVNVLDRVPHSIRPLFEELGTAEPLLYGAFRVSRFSFFQVNRFLIDALCEAAIGDSSGESAVDLYAGVGLFAAALGRGFQNVTAVEPSASAFRDLEFNVKCTTVRTTAEEFLVGLEKPPDLILADPPRAGLGKIVTTELIRLKAPQLTIVACDPATLARDLRVLLGRYRIERITMVDLFPQTAHLETVVHLRAT